MTKGKRPNRKSHPKYSEEGPVVQFDIYGVKGKVSPKDSEYEIDPKDWRAVGSAINGHLKRICVGLFGLIDDVLRGSRNLIRGISAIPSSLARRIDSAHESADQAEEQEQLKLEQSDSPISVDQAVQNLQDLLREIKGNGCEISVFEDNSTVIISFVPPELSEMLPGQIRKLELLENKFGPNPHEGEVESARNSDTSKEKQSPSHDEESPKPKRRAKGEIETRIYWGVFNQSLRRVAVFEFDQKEEAEKRAQTLAKASGEHHFLQKIKRLVR